MTVYNSLWLCTSINAPSSSLPKKRKNKKIENAYQWSVLYYIQFLNAVTWLKGIRDVAESGRSCVEMDGDSYRFVLKKANYGDGGTYIVKASNCHGSQKAYCTVRVSYRVDHPSLLLSSSSLSLIPLHFVNRSRKRPILPSGISRTRQRCNFQMPRPTAESGDSTKVKIRIH